MYESGLNELTAKYEANECLLCHDAACTGKCPYGLDPARAIRAFRFENMTGAARAAGDGSLCEGCRIKSCMSACTRGKIDKPLRIPQLLLHFSRLKPSRKRNSWQEASGQGGSRQKVSKTYDGGASAGLGINFCGIECENPFFLSSSVVASNYEMVARAFEAGWAGAAFKTIGTFVPDEVSPRFSALRKDGSSSFVGFKNIEQISDHSLEDNLNFISRLKREYPGKIIIASILGQNEEEWTILSRLMTEAGADIIECNFSCPHMTGEGLGSDVGQDPALVAVYTAAARRGTNLPILAKMTPNLGNMELPAIAAMKSGSTGIAAINTIKSIMNIDLDDFVSEPRVDGRSCVGGYSGKAVKPIALRYIHDLKKHSSLKEVPVSGMGGIETWKDAAEFIALGCENLQITTAVMEYGYRIIDDLLEGMTAYLNDKGMASINDLVGIALPRLVSANRLNRHSISYPRFDRNKCSGCGRCYLSCSDGGHQAISWRAKDGQPLLVPEKCTGCQLCAVVCPVNAISAGKRMEAV